MNISRKSTSKIHHKWLNEQNLKSGKEEAENGVTSTDSADSFQDALINLKALSGSGDMQEMDRSEVKEAQSSSSQQTQNGDSHDVASLSKESTEDEDIVEHIDDVNEAKMEGGSSEEDVLIIKVDECNDTGSESNSKSGSKVKNIPNKPSRTLLLNGKQVRKSVSSILLKYALINPDANSPLSKIEAAAAAENCAGDRDSNGAPPISLRHDRGNLFDNFEMKDSRTSLASDGGEKSQQLDSEKGDELSDFTAQEMDGAGDCRPIKCVNGKANVDSATMEPFVGGSLDKVADSENDRKVSSDGTELVKSSKPESLKSDSNETTVEKKSDALVKINSSPEDDSIACVSKTNSDVDKKDGYVCSSVESTNSLRGDCVDIYTSSSTAGTADCPKKEPDYKTELTETTDPESSNKVSGKVSESNTLYIKIETDRKRSVKDRPVEEESSQPFKRSRLDEVIGKLGERVTAIDDFEGSSFGDTDSVEKQSEEITGSTSDEEEDTRFSSKPKKFSITKQELETMVVALSKKAIEQYQSADILNLNRRLEELKESQEEWRQKAKKLERQVLDLTILQQRLEKRKAHAAALKSITTRSIGIWVTEDKFKSFHAPKHPVNRTPPATPPAAAQGPPVWGQPPVGSLVQEPPALSAPSVVTVTLASGSRNTSVAHLLSQTARMPTVASCVAANRTVAAVGKPITTGPRMTTPSSVVGSQGGSANPGSALPRGLAPSVVRSPNNLVVVNTIPSQTGASRALPAQQGAAAATVVSPAAGGQVKVIDLTMEDDPTASKQAGKLVAAGGVRAMVPQQAVRQMTPISQTMIGVPSSAIILGSHPGAQIVNAGNIQRPGMLQVVTIANAQALRPASFTVMSGQPGSVVRPPATTTTFTTNTRDSPLVMNQPIPASVAVVRPPTSGLTSANLRPALTPVGANHCVTVNRATVALATAQPSVAAYPSRPVLPDVVTHSAAPPIAKKNVHPAPLPESICPKGLPADLKQPPPRPGLKISRVKEGIVLSWNMSIPADCVEIALYQLYAYQETRAAPQPSLWKKVGDVRALPLPMACTLTQFQDSNKYHFAVRAVDVHGRSGPFSEPSSIYLSKAA